MIVAQAPGYANKTNPYNAMLCDALAEKGVQIAEFGEGSVLGKQAPAIVHVHWPEGPLNLETPLAMQKRLMRFWFRIGIAKLRGAKIVWTAHNLKPHESNFPGQEKAFYRWWLKKVDGIICLSQAALEALHQEYPASVEKPSAVIRHGDYSSKMDGNRSMAEAREMLDLPAESFIIGSVGAIRPYKNIPELIRLFKEVAHSDELLYIAGRTSTKSGQAELANLAAECDQIRLRCEFLSDHELETCTVACNAIVLPYLKILNSGSALYALSARRPVIIPRMGSLPELFAEVGLGWSAMYDPPLDAAQLRGCMDKLRAHTDRAEGPNLDLYQWDVIADQTISFYRSLTRSATEA